MPLIAVPLAKLYIVGSAGGTPVGDAAMNGTVVGAFGVFAVNVDIEVETKVVVTVLTIVLAFSVIRCVDVKIVGFPGIIMVLNIVIGVGENVEVMMLVSVVGFAKYVDTTVLTVVDGGAVNVDVSTLVMVTGRGAMV
jgi:hypothetical protein